MFGHHRGQGLDPLQSGLLDDVGLLSLGRQLAGLLIEFHVSLVGPPIKVSDPACEPGELRIFCPLVQGSNPCGVTTPSSEAPHRPRFPIDLASLRRPLNTERKRALPVES